MIKIEVLFPEVCNLYGDMFNIKYLEKCIDEVECIKTDLTDTPRFVSEDVNMIYMAPMPESIQELAIKKLEPYKERIKELIDKKVVFLLVGNAVEVFGKYIENEDGSKIEALGLLDLYAKRDMMHRHNSIFLGKYEDIEIDSQNQIASLQKNGKKGVYDLLGNMILPIQYDDIIFADNQENYFAKVEKGIGINKESKLEGIRVNNLIGTYLLGPVLVLNPLLTKKILEMLGVKEPKLKYEADLIDAYQKRLEEIRLKVK